MTLHPGRSTGRPAVQDGRKYQSSAENDTLMAASCREDQMSSVGFFITLGVTAVTLMLTPLASAQIVVVPSPASADDSLKLSVASIAPGSWAEVLATDYDVTQFVIRIDATVDVGPYSFPEPYDLTVTVPPVVPGHYEVQYWSTYVEGGSSSEPTLEWTTNLLVSRSVPVPSMGPSSIAVLALMISISGWLVLRNAHPSGAVPR
jgi:hypothetical protein